MTQQNNDESEADRREQILGSDLCSPMVKRAMQHFWKTIDRNETLRLAEEALKRIEDRKYEDVEAWASRLAQDLAAFKD